MVFVAQIRYMQLSFSFKPAVNWFCAPELVPPSHSKFFWSLETFACWVQIAFALKPARDQTPVLESNQPQVLVSPRPLTAFPILSSVAQISISRHRPTLCQLHSETVFFRPRIWFIGLSRFQINFSSARSYRFGRYNLGSCGDSEYRRLTTGLKSYLEMSSQWFHLRFYPHLIQAFSGTVSLNLVLVPRLLHQHFRGLRINPQL